MARETSDREDLMREATALVRRCRIQVDHEPIVVGFRRDGSASFFFDVDPVYQFNSNCQLRRAYRGGRLIKSESGRLVALDRRRTAKEVQLVRDPLSDEDQIEFLEEALRRLDQLSDVLRLKQFADVESVPAEDGLLESIVEWLAEMPRPLQVASVARL